MECRDIPTTFRQMMKARLPVLTALTFFTNAISRKNLLFFKFALGLVRLHLNTTFQILNMGYDDFTIASIYFFLQIIKDRFLEAAR